MEYGYIRVSSKEQNEDRQVDALRRFGIPEKQIFLDKQSGKDFEREGYQKLMKRLAPEDLLVIKSIDRLGRNYYEIMEQWRCITRGKGADICVLDMPLLDTRRGKDLLGSFIADLVLQILSFVAESERDSIRSRQMEGIAAAKARGVRFGRPENPLPAQFDDVIGEYLAGNINLTDGAAMLGMSTTTFWRHVQKKTSPTRRDAIS